MRTRELTADEQPTVLSERKPITMPLLALLGLLSATATGAIAYSNLKQSDAQQVVASQDQTKRIEDHEVRLRTIESATGRMDANLQQIREWMAEDRQRRTVGR